MQWRVLRISTLVLLSVCALWTTAFYVPAHAELLPNGWHITPVGKHIALMGDFPSRIVVTKDGTRLFVLTSGFHHQGVTVIDAYSRTVLSSANLGEAYGDMALENGSGRLFITGGGAVNASGLLNKLLLHKDELSSTAFDAALLRAKVLRNGLSMETPIRIPGLARKDQYVTGIAIGREGALFVVNMNNDTVYRLSPHTYMVEASAASAYGSYRAALSPAGDVLAVSNWGDESVNLFSAAKLKLIARIPTGIHPTDLAFGPDGRLFVANAGSNSVSVLEGQRVVETIKTSLHPADPVGSTPDAVAVDSAGKRLYVANADNNDVAVIDITDSGHSELEGFLPTGWHPSALALAPGGKTLYVGVAKGLRSRANVPALGTAARKEPDGRNSYDFVGDTLAGYISVLKVPTNGSWKHSLSR